MEHRDGTGDVLGADGVCAADGRGDDSDGGCRVGEEIRGGVQNLSATSARSFAALHAKRLTTEGTEFAQSTLGIIWGWLVAHSPGLIAIHEI